LFPAVNIQRVRVDKQVRFRTGTVEARFPTEQAPCALRKNGGSDDDRFVMDVKVDENGARFSALNRPTSAFGPAGAIQHQNENVFRLEFRRRHNPAKIWIIGLKAMENCFGKPSVSDGVNHVVLNRGVAFCKSRKAREGMPRKAGFPEVSAAAGIHFTAPV